MDSTLVINIGNMDHGTTATAEVKLDLSSLPPIFVSATHFTDAELHEVEDELLEANAQLTYDIHESRLILSKATKKAYQIRSALERPVDGLRR